MSTTAVNILIGAKDRATPTLKKTASAASSATSALKSMVGPIAAVGAAYLSWRGISSIIQESIGAFVIQEKAVEDLNAILEINGDKADELLPSYKSFASELQVLTNVGDETTLAMMKQARILGFQADEVEAATQAAIGLTEVGMSQEESIKALAKAREGDFGSLQELIPAIREAGSQQEKMDILNRKAAEGFKLAGRGTDTMGGSLQSMRNNWGDILETLGKTFGPLIASIANGFQKIAPMIQNALTTAQAVVLPIMQSIAEGVVVGIAVGEAVVSNFPQVFQLAFVQVQSVATTGIETVKHLFRQVPAVAVWAAGNISRIFHEVFDVLSKVVSSWVLSAATSFQTLLAWVQSGFQGGFTQLSADIGKNAGLAMVDGFKVSISQMPELFNRQLTATEKGLRKQALDIQTSLQTELVGNVAKRLGQFKTFFSFDDSGLDNAKKFRGLGLAGAGGAAIAGAGGSSTVENRFLSSRTGEVDINQKNLETNEKTAAFLSEISPVMPAILTAMQALVTLNSEKPKVFKG